MSQSIDAILVDLADYVKISVLEWPKRIVDQEKNQEDKTVRLMMISNAEFMDDMNLILGSYLSLTSAVRDEDNKLCMLRSNMTVYFDSDKNSPPKSKDPKRNINLLKSSGFKRLNSSGSDAEEYVSDY